MFVISVLAFFSFKFNAHGSLEDHSLVIRIPWINKAIILSYLMKEASIVVFCHFHVDMFQILGKLSLHFQQNDLMLPSPFHFNGNN